MLKSLKAWFFKTLFFLTIFLLFLAINPHSILAAGPDFIPTFESIGIYWNPSDSSSSNECAVQYRVFGETSWRDSLPLWYDDRSNGYYNTGEYRGSLVHLQAETNYEIRLTLNSGGTVTSNVSTWSEDFPIAQTIPIPSRNTTLTISQSGNSNGYILYDGQGSTIDVNKNADHNIIINASYVIIRNFNLRGARKDAIQIGNSSHQSVHHVVIEENEISGWSSSGDYNGDNKSAAIRTGRSGWTTPNPDIRQIVVQRNKIYNPSTDSTYWNEDPNHAHTAGPTGISLFNSGGNHVIRYNEIYSTNGNYYNDVLGAGANSQLGLTGFPGNDTDIYGNYLSHAWDDAIETEGTNRNVRVWANYIGNSLAKVATVSTQVGPLYIWRNVTDVAQKNPNVTDRGEGVFFKGGSRDPAKGGKINVFHNTMLQPPGSYRPLGPHEGIVNSGGGGITYLTTRNNILHINRSTNDAIEDGASSSTNDFDYDLYNGDIKGPSGSENHGIRVVPTYTSSNELDGNLTGDFTLQAGTSGHNDGALIPNFNDQLVDSRYNRQNLPDRGAHETGTPRMEFGVNAYRMPLPTIPPGSPTSTLSPTPSLPPATPTSTPGSFWEAEGAQLASATVETQHSGYTGSGYVNFIAVSGANIVWNQVNVPIAGNYILNFRYALGNTDRAVELNVNGQVVTPSLVFPSTSTWTNWQTLSFTTSLLAGQNTVEIATTGQDGPNLDHLFLEPSVLGDVNGDGVVDANDLNLVLAAWGNSVGIEDLNSDQNVNMIDSSIVLANWP